MCAARNDGEMRRGADAAQREFHIDVGDAVGNDDKRRRQSHTKLTARVVRLGEKERDSDSDYDSDRQLMMFIMMKIAMMISTMSMMMMKLMMISSTMTLCVAVLAPLPVVALFIHHVRQQTLYLDAGLDLAMAM